MAKFATDQGPLPLAGEYVQNPRRDQHVVSAAHHYQNLRHHDVKPKTWGYLGIFYADSTKRGVLIADA